MTVVRWMPNRSASSRIVAPAASRSSKPAYLWETEAGLLLPHLMATGRGLIVAFGAISGGGNTVHGVWGLKAVPLRPLVVVETTTVG